jgi:hypothetical protein
LEFIVINWHRDNNTSLVGQLTAPLYLGPLERKNPLIGSGSSSAPNTPKQNDVFTTNPWNPLLDKNDHLKILGSVFPLPVEKPKQPLRIVMGREEGEP